MIQHYDQSEYNHTQIEQELKENFFSFILQLDPSKQPGGQQANPKRSSKKLLLDVKVTQFTKFYGVGMLPNKFTRFREFDNTNIEFLLVKNVELIYSDTKVISLCILLKKNINTKFVKARIAQFNKECAQILKQTGAQQDQFKSFGMVLQQYTWGGLTDLGFIGRCYQQIQQISDILFCYHSQSNNASDDQNYLDTIGCTANDISTDLCKSESKKKLLKEAQKSFFKGTQQFKRELLTEFERQCWVHVGVLLRQDGDQGDGQTQLIKDRWTSWKRYRDYSCMIRCLALVSVGNCIKKELVPPEVNQDLNLLDVLDKWENEFTWVFYEHISKVQSEVVHPHPSLSALRSFVLDQKNIGPMREEMFLFNPSSCGVFYAVPTMLCLTKLAHQIFLKDVARKTEGSQLFLLGCPGAGKSMILGTIVEFFGGYQWQKKNTNFQCSAIAEKSIGVVDEFDMEQLLQENKGQNEWKQRLDQEDCCYIDRKGVQGLQCTRYFPFVMASNRTFSWYYKQICESFRRRICAIEFHQTMKEWRNQSREHLDVGTDMGLFESMEQREQKQMIGNLILLLPLFFCQAQKGARDCYFIEDRLVDYIIRLLVKSRKSVLLKNLFDAERRRGIAKAMDLYQEVHIDNRSLTGKAHSVVFLEQGGYSQALYGFGLIDSIQGLSSADISQLRADPYSRLALYNNRSTDLPESQELFSDTAQLHALLQTLPPNSITIAIMNRIGETSTLEDSCRAEEDEDDDELQQQTASRTSEEESKGLVIGVKRTQRELDENDATSMKVHLAMRARPQTFFTPKKQRQNTTDEQGYDSDAEFMAGRDHSMRLCDLPQ